MGKGVTTYRTQPGGKSRKKERVSLFPCLPDGSLTPFISRHAQDSHLRPRRTPHSHRPRRLPVSRAGPLTYHHGLVGRQREPKAIRRKPNGSHEFSTGEEPFRFSPEDYELDLFGLEHINTKAERRSRTNYVIRNTDTKNKPVSYWMATSKGEPLKALLEQDFSANLKEVKEARLRLVYVNDGDVSGPLKLTADYWKGIK